MGNLQEHLEMKKKLQKVMTKVTKVNLKLNPLLLRVARTQLASKVVLTGWRRSSDPFEGKSTKWMPRLMVWPIEWRQWKLASWANWTLNRLCSRTFWVNCNTSIHFLLRSDLKSFYALWACCWSLLYTFTPPFDGVKGGEAASRIILYVFACFPFSGLFACICCM